MWSFCVLLWLWGKIKLTFSGFVLFFRTFRRTQSPAFREPLRNNDFTLSKHFSCIQTLGAGLITLFCCLRTTFCPAVSAAAHFFPSQESAAGWYSFFLPWSRSSRYSPAELSVGKGKCIKAPQFHVLLSKTNKHIFMAVLLGFSYSIVSIAHYRE